MLQRSTALYKFTELEADGTIAGYASTFGGAPDNHGDIVAAGAFSEAIAAHKARGTVPKMFWQHNPNEPIGRWEEMAEDASGLLVKGRLNMGVQRAREAHALLQAGDIDGLSIGYGIKDYSVEKDTDVWTLLKLDLFEISVVTMPANENATVSDVKAQRSARALIDRLASGERLKSEEMATVLRDGLGLSTEEAERAAQLHLKQSDGAPTRADRDTIAFLSALAT